MINLDFWYGNKPEEITRISITFYPNDGEYRGNMYIDDKIVGDYAAYYSIAIEQTFPQLVFNWD